MSLLLEAALKNALFDGGYIERDNWKIVMAEPVAAAVTKKGDPNVLAQAILDNLASEFPPEIVDGGNESIANMFRQHGYDLQKSFLLNAAARVNESE